jgi:hypothetical protein
LAYDSSRPYVGRDERSQVESLILFCPVCCSTVEIEAQDGDQPTLICTSCDQEFSMTISLARLRAHSIAS